MSTRRKFLKGAVLTGAALAVGAGPAAASMMDPHGYPGILYSEADQGMWQGKAGSHAPQVTVSGGKATVVTAHSMSAEHFIVRHTLVAADGTVVGSRTFGPEDVPMSEYELPGAGAYTATSFCNKHDMWITQFTA